MADTETGTIDFTVMYATHNAFRRDLARLSAQAESGTPFTDTASATWQNFKRQLHIHHTVEDAQLWPRVQRAVADRADDLLVMKQMEAEHEQLGPLLEKVDEALAAQDTDLTDRFRDLATALDDHMRHEESSALPLIQRVLTPQDWKAFRSAMARSQGPKGADVYVPLGRGRNRRRRTPRVLRRDAGSFGRIEQLVHGAVLPQKVFLAVVDRTRRRRPIVIDDDLHPMRRWVCVPPKNEYPYSGARVGECAILFVCSFSRCGRWPSRPCPESARSARISHDLWHGRTDGPAAHRS